MAYSIPGFTTTYIRGLWRGLKGLKHPTAGLAEDGQDFELVAESDPAAQGCLAPMSRLPLGPPHTLTLTFIWALTSPFTSLEEGFF